MKKYNYVMQNKVSKKSFHVLASDAPCARRKAVKAKGGTQGQWRVITRY